MSRLALVIFRLVSSPTPSAIRRFLRILYIDNVPVGIEIERIPEAVRQPERPLVVERTDQHDRALPELRKGAYGVLAEDHGFAVSLKRAENPSHGHCVRERYVGGRCAMQYRHTVVVRTTGRLAGARWSIR